MSTVALHSRISFPESGQERNGLLLKNPISVRIEASWKMLTDSATIILPYDAVDLSVTKIKEVFRKGDPVTIELGGNGEMVAEFAGYITRVNPGDDSLELKCEDEMWKLKQLPVHVSIEQCSLEELLVTILPGYDLDVLDVELGDQRHPNSTVAKVLKYLQEEYGLYSYIKNGHTLVCGKIYQDDYDMEAVAVVLDACVSDDLNYQNKDDISIKIKAVSTLPNGSKIEVEYGDEGGEERQLTYYNIEDKEALTELAKKDYAKYKADGFTGSVTLYSRPVVYHGQKVQLISVRYPERDGIYYVDSTTVDYDAGGYHRQIKIGDQV